MDWATQRGQRPRGPSQAPHHAWGTRSTHRGAPPVAPRRGGGEANVGLTSMCSGPGVCVLARGAPGAPCDIASGLVVGEGRQEAPNPREGSEVGAAGEKGSWLVLEVQRQVGWGGRSTPGLSCSLGFAALALAGHPGTSVQVSLAQIHPSDRLSAAWFSQPGLMGTWGSTVPAPSPVPPQPASPPGTAVGASLSLPTPPQQQRLGGGWIHPSFGLEEAELWRHGGASARSHSDHTPKPY